MSNDMIKIKKESEDMLGCCSDGQHYPYGTSISFDNDMLDDLGIDALAVGDEVDIRGCAFVDSKSEHKSKEYSNKDIRFQITDIKIKRKSEDTVTKLYGG